MADLPDISTSDVSWIAYWNIVEDGGLDQDFDIDEILNSGNVSNNELYDNGVEADYSTINNDTVRIRGKDDGWIVVYADRTGSHTTNTGSIPRGGRFTVAPHWTPTGDQDSGPTTSSFTYHPLERAINDLQSQLSNSNGISYNSSDVGLFNYEHDAATTTTLLQAYRHRGENLDDGTFTDSFSFTYTDDTDIYGQWHLAAAAGKDDSADGNVSGGTVYWEGNTLASASTSGSNTERYAAHDGNYVGYAANSGTQYNGQLELQYGNRDEYDVYASARLSQLMVWG